MNNEQTRHINILLGLQQGDVQRYTQWLWFNRDAMQFASDSRRRPVRFVEFDGAPQLTPSHVEEQEEF